jgi:predicted  nucleic acid-binding Zn-ribbon protein
MRRTALVFVVAAACSGSQPAAKPDPAAASQSELQLKLQAAQTEAEQARYEARAAQEKLEKIEHDLDDLTAKVDGAVNSIMAAQNDADRAAASSKLQALQKEQAEMKARIRDARDAAEKADKKKSQNTVQMSKECMDNPLAKGCS